MTATKLPGACEFVKRKTAGAANTERSKRSEVFPYFILKDLQRIVKLLAKA